MRERNAEEVEEGIAPGGKKREGQETGWGKMHRLYFVE